MAKGRYVALIRGLNVGRARRIGMAELRVLVGDLGYGDVRTLLNSGNVVFTARGVSPEKAAARIADALSARLGVPTSVTVLTGAALAAAVSGNPLTEVATNPSRLLVAFLAKPSDISRLEPLLDADWSPEAFALGPGVAYLWCPAGALAGRLPEAVGRVLGDAMTTRNWATVSKLHALALS